MIPGSGRMEFPPWRRELLPTAVFLPGEFHGQRRLVDYSPRGPKESDTTEQLTLLLSMSLFDHHPCHLVYPTVEHHPARNLQQKLRTSLLMRSISHSTFFIYCTNLFFFLHFSCICTFLEIIKPNTWKMLLFLLSLILKWLHRIHQF